MSLIPMTTLFYKALILQGEIWRWSLLGLKYITLLWLPWFLDLNKPWSRRYDRKYDTYDFPAHDYTQMAVSVKKDCCDPEFLLPW